MMPVPPPVGYTMASGHTPAELLGYLQAHGLLALSAARFFQCGEVKQTLLGGDADRNPPGVADESIN